MQWNTSCDESLVLYHLSSDSVYYTIFVNSAVTNLSGSFSTSPASRSLSSGIKSILRAFANFAAVRNEKLTSWRSTFVMYGRETFIRLASSVCDAQLLHPPEYPTKEGRTDMVECGHWDLTM